MYVGFGGIRNTKTWSKSSLITLDCTGLYQLNLCKLKSGTEVASVFILPMSEYVKVLEEKF